MMSDLRAPRGPVVRRVLAPDVELVPDALLGEERGDAVYFNNPVDFVTGLDGSDASLLLVVGRGQWEDTTGALEHTLRFAELLRERGIRHELDVWGEEAPHDWPAWRAQLAKHLPRFV